jgi:GNAT superfamily N-acetyltransferase
VPDPRIRPAQESDVPAVVGLVYELAGYERALQCHLTGEQLREALFGPSSALFCHVAEVDGEVAGFALWLLKFDSYQGRYAIYLETLFVQPTQRGSGLRKALLTVLAEECVRRDYPGLEWTVLDWNTPAIDFYKALGAVPIQKFKRFHLADNALAALAESVA